jgi:hypothetical protein
MAVSRPSGNVWDRLTAEAQNEIMAGALAIRRIRQHEDYSHWVAVGKALLRLQEEAMRLAGSNSPQGRGYTALRAELGSCVPDLEELNKASKSHAVWLAKNLAAVEKWRKTLWFNLRDTLNHPSVIKRRYEATGGFGPALATRGFGIALGEEAKPLSLAAKKDTEIARLQEELDAANAKIRRLERGEGDMLLISRKDTPEAILTVLESEIPTKAGRIAALLLNRQKSTAPRPAKVARGADESIEAQIRSLRAAHPDWDHKQIGKAVRRASSVVARVLEEPEVPAEKLAAIARGARL